MKASRNSQRAEVHAASAAVPTSPDALAFLPAALEVLHTPPPRASRWLGWTIVLSAAAALVWAIVGRVDTVVVAPGQLIPDGRSKAVQAARTGVVRSINVREGQRVAAGDILVELDPTEDEVALAQLSRSTARQSADIIRIDTLLRALTGAGRGIADTPPFRQELRRDEQQRLVGDWQELRATTAGLESELDRAAARERTAAAQLDKTNALIATSSEREAALAELLARGAVARPKWLGAHEALIALRHDRTIQTDMLAEYRHAVTLASRTLERYRAERQAALLRERQSTSEQLSASLLELARARARLARSVLRAPVAGIVHELAAHTVGGVVTTAGVLMRIVPSDASLIAEAWLGNADMGHVRPDHPLEVKLSAFPFTRYGVLRGRITHLSADATHDPARGAVYAVRASIDRDHLLVGGRMVRLTAGMALTAEVHTGRRRIIEFLLDPLLRGISEALRER